MEQWLTPPLVISLAAFGLTVLSTYHNRKKDNKQEFDKRFEAAERAIEQIEKEVADARADAKVVSLQVGLFWKTIETNMAKKFRDE